MSTNENETLASLKVLVCMAKADGVLHPEERSVLDDALAGAKLAGNVTVQSLLDGTHDFDAALNAIKSQEVRDATFSSAFAIAYADRWCDPAEQALLERIEKAFVVSTEKKSLFGRLFAETKDTVSLSNIKPIADPKARQKEIDEDVLKYSILSAVLGAFPIPIASIATDLAVVGLQAKMFRDIGQYWGRETSKDTVKQVMGGIGVGTGARIAVNNLAKFIPGVGSVVAASTNFASTWALGKVANQYWESGGKADMKMLKELFVKSRAEGKTAYEKNKAAIEAKQKQNKPLLDSLAADYKAGKITQADYERRVLELK
jgi:uncharacterized protein (DUF697 family)/tellurite resistance protein